MKMEKWTDENIKKIEKFIDIKNRGYYASGQEVTKVYNEVLGKNIPPSNCSSCIKSRIDELAKALNRFKETMNKATEADKTVDAKADSTDKGVEEKVEVVVTEEPKEEKKPTRRVRKGGK